MEEISYCSSCRASILEQDLESGEAVALLGRQYCSRCKGSALRALSLEEALAGFAPGKRPAASPPPPAGRPPRKAPISPRRLPSARHLPLLLASTGAVLLLVFLAILLRPRGTPAPRREDNAPAGPPDRREAAAEEAYAAAERACTASDPDAALKAIRGARIPCRGTSWEGRLQELEALVLRRKEEAEELTRLTIEIQDLMAADPDFSRYEAVTEKGLRARNLAARVAPHVLPDLQKRLSEYAEAYEKRADSLSGEILETANGLAQERRYDDALRVLEAFPRPLRRSRAWMGLEALRRRIENLKKADPGRP